MFRVRRPAWPSLLKRRVEIQATTTPPVRCVDGIGGYKAKQK